MTARGPITLEEERQEDANEKSLIWVFVGFAVSFMIVVMLIGSISTAIAKRAHPEKWYQETWCGQRNGQTEFVLPNNTRVDCLLEDQAVEFDFASKWAEAIGQSLHYGMWTGRKSAIVLIIEDRVKDMKYVDRCVNTIEHYGLPIQFWLMYGEAE